MTDSTQPKKDLLENIPHASSSFTDKDRETIEKTKFVGEMGNAYVIKQPDGKMDWISKQAEVILLYEHGLYDLIQGGSGTNPTIISESKPFVAVAPTSNKLVYTIWYNDERPVQNPPSMCERVLRGIVEAVEEKEYEVIKNSYKKIIDNQVNVKKVNDILNQHEPIPPASVVPVEEGWVIEGTFLVTWEGSIYLRTQDTTEDYFYREGGYRSSSAPEVLTLYPTLPEEEVEVPLIRPNEDDDSDTINIEEPENLQTKYNSMLRFGGVEDINSISMDDVKMVTLDRDELVFFTKALWLVNYRENYDDDLFWEVIEKHVQKNLQNSVEK